MRINVQGFIIIDYIHKFPETVMILKKSLAEGKLKIDGGESIVTVVFEEIPKTWMRLFEGGNQGKLITALP